jgi:hypothetical protein
MSRPHQPKIKGVRMADRCVLPVHVKPEELAQHIGASERALRKLARELGACRIIGGAMILLPEDVQVIMEASRPCHSGSASAAQSGTTAAPLPEGNFEALQAQRTRPPRKGSRRKSKPERGEVILMGQRRT